MNGFDLLKRDKRLFISNNLFSTPCTLSNGTTTQSDLKCVSNYIGITNTTTKSADTNATSIINDSAEAVLNIDDVTIGKPETNWTLSFAPRNDESIINFRIDYVMEDRTTGIYKLSLSVIKQNNNPNPNNNTIQFRANGGI